jgi:hypothetical protein
MYFLKKLKKSRHNREKKNNVLNELVINIELDREKSNPKSDYISYYISKYAHDYAEPFDHIDAEFELYLECDNKEKVSEDLSDENTVNVTRPRY